jgi:hypothetical protein
VVSASVGVNGWNTTSCAFILMDKNVVDLAITNGKAEYEASRPKGRQTNQ